ncbi:hypothetical protein F4819DRAFT_478921 [Hypoxylon fuscum]|nr:hypothetical protein F4819DRAFT_478921 [Hypoxylon fuscum]
MSGTSEEDVDVAEMVGDGEVTNGPDVEQLPDTADFTDAPLFGDEMPMVLASSDDDPTKTREWRSSLFEKLFIQESDQTWAEVLLNLIPEGPDKVSLEDFINSHSAGNWSRGESMEDVDLFHDSVVQDWANHDSDITELWNGFVGRIKNLQPRYDEKLLCKPSGPLSAILTIIWHYPTFLCSKTHWGSTYDQKNPSLLTQKWKVGSSPFVRTQDSIPIRSTFKHNCPADFETWKQWPKIEKECNEFNRVLIAHSKFIILIGKRNFESMESLVAHEGSCELVTLELNHPQLPTMFEKPASVCLVRDRETREVRHVVFLSNHCQSFFYNPDPRTAAYHDLLWNAALSLSGLPVSRPYSFMKTASAARVGTPRNAFYIRTTLGMLVGLRKQEKALGITYSREFVINACPTLDPDVLKEYEANEGGSYVLMALAAANSGHQIRRHIKAMTTKAREGVQAALESKEWQDLVAFKRELYEADKVRIGWYKNLGMKLPTHNYVDIGRKTLAFALTRQALGICERAGRRRISFCDWRDERISEGDQDFASLPEEDQLHMYHEEASPFSFKDDCFLTILESPETMSHIWRKNLLYRHVVFYSTQYPGGLRWPGDGNPDLDEFDYTQDHPAVCVEGKVSDRVRMSLASPEEAHNLENSRYSFF